MADEYLKITHRVDSYGAKKPNGAFSYPDESTVIIYLDNAGRKLQQYSELTEEILDRYRTSRSTEIEGVWIHKGDLKEGNPNPRYQLDSPDWGVVKRDKPKAAKEDYLAIEAFGVF